MGFTNHAATLQQNNLSTPRRDTAKDQPGEQALWAAHTSPPWTWDPSSHAQDQCPAWKV